MLGSCREGAVVSFGLGLLQTVTSVKRPVHSSCPGMDIEHRGPQKVNG